MAELRLTLNKRHCLWVATGLLCCVLLALAGVVQVAHTHAAGQAAPADCALCMTAHLTVQEQAPQSMPVIVWMVAVIAAALPPIRGKCFWMFSLFTRPPPVVFAFA